MAACGGAPSTAPAGIEPPPPLDFAHRAPADTRLLASLDLASPFGLAMIGSLPATTGCAAPPDQGLLQVAVTDRSEVVVELVAAITVADLACMFSIELEPDGRLRFGPLIVESIAGGVRAGTAGGLEAATSTSRMADRFTELTADHEMVAMAEVGPGAAPIHVEITADGIHQRTTMRFAETTAARSAAAAIIDVLTRASSVEPVSGAVIPTLDGATVTIASTLVELDHLLGGGGLVESLRIPAPAMLPTLEVGDDVLAINGAFIHGVARGDLVVHQLPTHPDRADLRFVKRVVAIGGDTVEVDVDAVGLTVNGVPQQRRAIAGRYAAHNRETGGWSVQYGALSEELLAGRPHRVLDLGEDLAAGGTWTVPEGHVFLMGDNRSVANDSRSWGSIPVSAVLAVPLVIWFSYGPDGVRWERILTPVE